MNDLKMLESEFRLLISEFEKIADLISNDYFDSINDDIFYLTESMCELFKPMFYINNSKTIRNKWFIDFLTGFNFVNNQITITANQANIFKKYSSESPDNRDKSYYVYYNGYGYKLTFLPYAHSSKCYNISRDRFAEVSAMIEIIKDYQSILNGYKMTLTMD